MDEQKLRQFESIFYPKSIAVDGDSGGEQEIGTIYLRNLLKVSG